LLLATAITGGCLVVACGALAPAADRRSVSPPVELMLLNANGQSLDLRELRGRPLLLFVFTTFDDTCQLALIPLERALRAHPELRALGIAVQPEPQQLLPLYRDALAVSFPLTYEPDNQVVAGKTMLGPIQTVPTYVLLDAQGRIAARHTGALNAAALEELFALASR
jgi:peroxiredoxin